MNEFTPDKCRAALEKLSPQMRAVLVHMVNGLSVKQIAAEMKLGHGTVRIYREQIYSRLNVPTAAVAVRVAVTAGISTPAKV